MKTREEILLRIAQLKLAYAQKDFEITKELIRKGEGTLLSLDQNQLAVDLAQCDVELAELDLAKVRTV